MKVLKNLLVLFFLSRAQVNLDRAKKMYEQYEGLDEGQEWGDLYMVVHRLWRSCAEALTKPKQNPLVDAEYAARREGRLP